MMIRKIAIFASGAGSNAEKIIGYFNAHKTADVSLIVCNNPAAGVINVAKAANIETLLIEKAIFFSGNGYVPELVAHKIDFIVLAGFLWKIPEAIIEAYRGHVINIHPALLPKYGGKGMYGAHVHKAVIAAGETASGITIHYVDEHYDKGDIIFQAKCPVLANETAESLAEKVHQLEHRHFPETIENIVLGRVIAK